MNSEEAPRVRPPYHLCSREEDVAPSLQSPFTRRYWVLELSREASRTGQVCVPSRTFQVPPLRRQEGF